jgi:hypothetical protein
MDASNPVFGRRVLIRVTVHYRDGFQDSSENHSSPNSAQEWHEPDQKLLQHGRLDLALQTKKSGLTARARPEIRQSRRGS